MLKGFGFHLFFETIVRPAQVSNNTRSVIDTAKRDVAGIDSTYLVSPITTIRNRVLKMVTVPMPSYDL